VRLALEKGLPPKMKVRIPVYQKTAVELERFFGPEGGIVTQFGGRARWSQAEMALTFNKAIHQQQSMLIEAPTGTGKTLAYLIPIALYLRSKPKQRFVIAVATKHLQAQIERDMEKFSEEFPELKESAVLKGANNYLCLNRLKRAAVRSQHNRQVEAELRQLLNDFERLEKLPHGWREELPIKISDTTWAQVNGEGNCCKSLCGCYRRQARKLAEKAKIVVVNTDLLGYNLKYTGKPVPAAADAETLKPILILDEAHTLLSRLTEVESADVSIRTLESAVHMLGRDTFDRPHLRTRLELVSQRLLRIRHGLDQGPEGQEIVKPDAPAGIACRELVSAIREIKGMATWLRKEAPNDEVAEDYRDVESRLGFSEITLNSYLENKLPHYVMLLNRTLSPSGQAALNLELKPFDLEDSLNKLWGNFQQCTLISATLVGTSIPETKKTFNACNWSTANFPSPFDYKKQMRVFLPPRGRSITESPAIAEEIKRIAKITDGRVMALFTNYKQLQETQLLVQDWCAREGYRLHVQERNTSPEVLVEKYNREPRAIILGNHAMGTGVDLRIRALIITKIPFDQQTPYREARQKYLEGKKLNPFRDDTLPETVRRWKQWWGRLIREENQKGLLVMLDPKLLTASYSSYFLQSLPGGTKATHLDDPAYPLPTQEQYVQWANDNPQTKALAVEMAIG
jgi:ATP-dependent DNA helicase DinG